MRELLSVIIAKQRRGFSLFSPPALSIRNWKMKDLLSKKLKSPQATRNPHIDLENRIVPKGFMPLIYIVGAISIILCILGV